jgi:hypothetical protein
MARALADTRRPATCTWREAPQGRTLVGEAGEHEQLVRVGDVGTRVVGVGGVGDGAGEHFADIGGDAALGELQHFVGVPHVEPADQVEHGACLVGGRADVLGRGLCAVALTTLERGDGGALVQLRTAHQRRAPFSCPAWNLNVRVGLNSPSL